MDEEIVMFYRKVAKIVKNGSPFTDFAHGKETNHKCTIWKIVRKFERHRNVKSVW